MRSHFKDPKIRHKLQILLLLIILNGGFIMRIHNLSGNPAGFFCDEASIGYNAYLVLTTGKDEQGVFLPLFFRSLGDYRPAIAVYSTIPFIAIFGLTELAIRMPSVIYGLLTILTIYFIGKELSANRKNRTLGLWASLIAATMPWLIHYNRTGFEFTSYVTLFTLTILLLLKTLHRKTYIIPAFTVAAITVYTYQPARLLIPLLLIGFVWINRRQILLHKKSTLIALSSFFVLSIPLIINVLSGDGLMRFTMVSVFSAKLPLDQTILRVAQNYLTQISPIYFVTGEPTFITRHFVGGLTPLLLMTIPFVLIGFLSVLRTVKKDKHSQLITYWLLIYPIAGAVTADAPFTSRSIIGAPLFAILISIGIATTIASLRKTINQYVLISVILLGILLNLVFFTRFYFNDYPLYSANFWGWQYGARDTVKYFSDVEKDYDDLIMAPEFNASEIFFKFYAPQSCIKCTIGLPDSAYTKGRRQLFAITPDYMSAHANFSYKQIRIIRYPNNSIAFFLVEITNRKL